MGAGRDVSHSSSRASIPRVDHACVRHLLRTRTIPLQLRPTAATFAISPVVVTTSSPRHVGPRVPHARTRCGRAQHCAARARRERWGVDGRGGRRPRYVGGSAPGHLDARRPKCGHGVRFLRQPRGPTGNGTPPATPSALFHMREHINVWTYGDVPVVRQPPPRCRCR